MENFGILQGDYRIPTGQKGAAFISSTALGKAIKSTLRRFNSTEPNVRVLQYALMPDHLHILLFVEYPTEDTLGKIIARFKIEVNKASGITGVFAKGFNDQILKSSRSLAVLYRYLRENARRLAVRRARPEFFRRVNALEIGGKPLTAESSSLRSYPRQKKRSAKRPKRPEDASSSSSANRWENATNPLDGTLSCARQGGCS